MFQLCEDFQVKSYFARRCIIRIAVSGPADHRPYSLPIQWLPLRDPDTVHGPGPQQLNPAPVRAAVRCSTMLQAHIPVSRACVLRLSSPRLLSGGTVVLPVFQHTILQLRQLGCGHHSRIRKCFWAVCNVGSTAASGQSLVPVFARTLPCLLGAERLGYVLIHRSSADLLYAIPNYCCTELTTIVAPRLGLHVDPEAVNSVTRGLVGDTSFAVLPDIVPLTCFLLTLGAQIVCMLSLPKPLG
jgi:hypothetical protein